MRNEMSSKYKSCPFCGSREAAFIDHEEICYIRRLEKHANSKWTAYTTEEMDEAWNTRYVDKQENQNG